MAPALQRAWTWNLLLSIVAISAAALTFAASLYLSGRVNSALDKLQNEYSVNRVASVLQAIDQNTHHLIDYTKGYAMWDDVFRYLENRDPAFLETNFAESVLAATPVQLVAIYNLKGEIVFSTALDAQSRIAPAPGSLRNFPQLEKFDALTKPGDCIGRVEWIEDRAYLLAICPITDSAGTAPIRGYLLFGSVVGEGMLARLQTLTASKVTVDAERVPLKGDFQITTPDLGVAEVNIEESQESSRALALFREDNDRQHSVVFHIELPAGASATGRRLAGLIGTVFLLVAAGFALFMGLSVQEILHRRAEIRRRIRESEELKEARQNADRLAEEAGAADRAKSDFLAMISHEIRTPLNAVVGYANLLRDNPSEDLLARLEIISKSGATLQHLVEDILDFSRIEAGKIDIHFRPASIHDLIQDVIDVSRPMADAADNRILVGVHSDVPEALLLDDQRVKQVLGNLLSNAVKFTQKGSITISAYCEPVISAPGAPAPPGADCILCIAVEDEGIGVPEEREVALFEPFSQADSTISRRYGGAGLGLVICRKLCALMGGDIAFERRPAKGSRFTVRLPTRRAEAVEKNRPADPAAIGLGSDLHILIVDDNAVNARLLKAVLKRLGGYSADSVLSGEEALDYFVRTPPDLIFMDIHMPGLDGLAVARHIRELEKESGRPPCLIFAVTADTLVTDRERSRTAGMDGHINKPFTLEDIAQALSLRIAGGKASS